MKSINLKALSWSFTYGNSQILYNIEICLDVLNIHIQHKMLVTYNPLPNFFSGFGCIYNWPGAYVEAG